MPSSLVTVRDAQVDLAGRIHRHAIDQLLIVGDEGAGQLLDLFRVDRVGDVSAQHKRFVDCRNPDRSTGMEVGQRRLQSRHIAFDHHRPAENRLLVSIDGIERSHARILAEQIDQPRRLDLNIGNGGIRDENRVCVPIQCDQYTLADIDCDRRTGRPNHLLPSRRRQGEAKQDERRKAVKN